MVARREILSAEQMELRTLAENLATAGEVGEPWQIAEARKALALYLTGSRAYHAADALADAELLRADRDALDRQLRSERAGEAEELLALRKHAELLRADRDALAEALLEYGRHRSGCGVWAGSRFHARQKESPDECTCGLLAALAVHGSGEEPGA